MIYNKATYGKWLTFVYDEDSGRDNTVYFYKNMVSKLSFSRIKIDLKSNLDRCCKWQNAHSVISFIGDEQSIRPIQEDDSLRKTELPISSPFSSEFRQELALVAENLDTVIVMVRNVDSIVWSCCDITWRLELIIFRPKAAERKQLPRRSKNCDGVFLQVCENVAALPIDADAVQVFKIWMGECRSKRATGSPQRNSPLANHRDRLVRGYLKLQGM